MQDRYSSSDDIFSEYFEPFLQELAAEIESDRLAIRASMAQALQRQEAESETQSVSLQPRRQRYRRILASGWRHSRAWLQRHSSIFQKWSERTQAGAEVDDVIEGSFVVIYPEIFSRKDRSE